MLTAHSLNKQISALNQHIEGLENGAAEDQVVDTNAPEADQEVPGEEEESEYDEFIREALAAHPSPASFFLNDLFGQDRWSEIPVKTRQALEKRFRHQVERGDFVGIETSSKSSGKIQNYFKSR